MPASGGCLCGAVRFEVEGELGEVLLCHCSECRRWHGHVCAATRVPEERLTLVERRGLRWIDSPNSAAHARRGFCGECGSSLFWDAPGRDTISVSAGSFDEPTGLTTTAQIYVAGAGDYYEVDPRLPGFEGTRGPDAG